MHIFANISISFFFQNREHRQTVIGNIDLSEKKSYQTNSKPCMGKQILGEEKSTENVRSSRAFASHNSPISKAATTSKGVQNWLCNCSQKIFISDSLSEQSDVHLQASISGLLP